MAFALTATLPQVEDAYKSWRFNRTLHKFVDTLKDIEKQDYLAAMADTYGGKTPQETLKLYIDAVENGDYELASKYFIGSKQKKWFDELNAINKLNKIGIYVRPLREIQFDAGEYSFDQLAYSVYKPVLVDFRKYPNGIWKIIEI